MIVPKDMAQQVTMFRAIIYAMVNGLSLLGWSHPDEKDVFTREELLLHFDLKG